MRLLIIAQKIDRADPVLGFFHRWVEEFSKHVKSVVVVCLQKGDYDLPANVAVLSLGKEKWRSKLKYIFLLFYFSIRYFNRYDAVLVHMGEEYVIVAGWLWKLLGKRVYLWRNHRMGGAMTDIAALFCTSIFCTSRYSYTAKFKRTRFMPVGVDTEAFRPDPAVRREPNSMLSLGRLSRIKNLEVLVRAVEIIKHNEAASAGSARAKKSGPRAFALDIYGDPSPHEDAYAVLLHTQVAEAGLSDKVKFFVGVPNKKTPAVYSAHEIFVNLTGNGSYDKTIFEALACGCFVFASNDDLRGKLDDSFIFAAGDAEDLAAKISAFMALPKNIQAEKAAGISALVREHSLSRLAEVLIAAIR